MKTIKFCLAFILLALSSSSALKAQSESTDRWPKPDHYGGRITLLAGLSQPLFLSGINLAATYYTDRFTFEYSHGQWLTYPANIRDEQLQRLHSPYSTGFGVGYRFTRALDLRLEVKANGYEADLSDGSELTYTTFVVGLGAYYRFHLWRGIIVEPSLRYWPNAASTLPNGQHSYSGPDGQALVHEAHDYGLFANVSIGYVFGSR